MAIDDDEFQELVSAIDEHIQSRGKPYSEWYVGITRDATTRLFTEHHVDKDTGRWIHRTASTHQMARAVERYFLDVKRTQGGPGGGDTSSCMVYAYRITLDTEE